MLENAEPKKVLDDVPDVEELAEVDVNEDGYERTRELQETQFEDNGEYLDTDQVRLSREEDMNHMVKT